MKTYKCLTTVNDGKSIFDCRRKAQWKVKTKDRSFYVCSDHKNHFEKDNREDESFTKIELLSDSLIGEI